jgi:hypothetical protein
VSDYPSLPWGYPFQADIGVDCDAGVGAGKVGDMVDYVASETTDVNTDLFHFHHQTHRFPHSSQDTQPTPLVPHQMTLSRLL